MDTVVRLAQRPIILVAMSSPDSRRDVSRELERRYSSDYRLLEASVPENAREQLRLAFDRGIQVALVLAEDPSPASAESVFAEAKRLFPDVRRCLVIEWGSWAERSTTDAVIDLMARLEIDYYVIRPWRSPDERFHRIVTEFLLDWRRAIGERPSDVTVIGDPSLPRTHELRGLLARRGVSPRLVPAESPEGHELIRTAGVEYDGRPLVRLLDGRMLEDPDNAQLARAYGLATHVPTEPVDLAIVGAGPGGLAAAVYAASEGLRVLVVEREAVGGQAGSSSLIRNYLGFSRGVSGAELAQRAYQQAWAFGAEFAHAREVVGRSIDHDGFRLAVAPDEHVLARSVILASGVSYRRLELGDLKAYVGAAVFYGASTAEARAQAGRIVHVVGGGNSAGQAALHLARYAMSVSLIVRGRLADSMSQYLIDQLDTAGVAVLTGFRVVGGGGIPGGDGDRLDHIVLRQRETGEETTVRSDALFITIGAAPHTGWLPAAVLRDNWGFVFTGAAVVAATGSNEANREDPPGALESSVPGFFAVGDVRRGSIKRVASAVGEGSVVVSAVHTFLARAEQG
ncbi:thioredoxin reductase (NADPH) [Marisediminicola sp. UYEF4]|uniref:FAD-dependent oxidoreductase n=1 Tax=Marisediminicola sp. UYEF4 TaxID=1756384 RepID=UPI0033995DB5